jgi:ABC-type multidrug transport system fused ATPase/permease subunit
LKRAYLVESNRDRPATSGSSAVPPEGQSAPRFTLNSPIDDEGSNLWIGQRSLVSLAIALVNDTMILIIDEAQQVIVMFFLVAHALMMDFYAASADYETDSKIQDTIANEFKERTILCIARTVSGHQTLLCISLIPCRSSPNHHRI